MMSERNSLRSETMSLPWSDSALCLGFVLLQGSCPDENHFTLSTTVNNKKLSFAEIARDADEIAIQGHSRSCVVVQIHVAYMTSY